MSIEVRDLPARFAALPGAGAVLEALGDGDEGVYAVGGTVRDLLLGGAPKDLDLVVEGDVAPLARRLGHDARPHPRFGTATVAGPDGVRYDLAMARRERYRRPGALPEVQPASIGEDLTRRDFTVNALGLALGGPGAGAVVAVPHAEQDLRDRQLRVLHAQSFLDDPTRLLRLVRYGARLGFTTEDETVRLAREAVAAGAFGWVTGPRLAAELSLAGQEADPVAVWERMQELGIDTGLLAGLEIREPAVVRTALRLLPAEGDREAVLLGAASEAVDPAPLEDWMGRLGLPVARRAAVREARRAPALARALARARTPAAIAEAVASAGPEVVALAGAHGAEHQAREWLERLRHMDTVLRGGDLIAAGVSPGPAIAHGLAAARAAVRDGRAPDRDAQLAAALRAITGH